MSRYTGPRLKKVRALGAALPGLTRHTSDRRPYPPGQHGQARKKLLDFGLRLREKQKLKYNYGLTEGQLRRVVAAAQRSKGITGEVILQSLERRLDNVVWRAGFAATIPAARQLVTHGHVNVNGKRLDIASALVSLGDIVSLRASTLDNVHVKESLSASEHSRPSWLTWDDTLHSATINTHPDITTIPLEINMQLVVEFYSRSL